MRYALACTIVRHRVFIEGFTPQSITDPEILNTMKKIELIVADEELNKFAPYPWECKITVVTKDGRSISGEQSLPKGEPENPLTYEELKQKFISLALPVIKSGSRVEDIITSVNNIERTSDISESLTSLL